MAAYLNRLHHVSLHVSDVDKLAHDLVSKFKFNLFAARRSDKSHQLAFRKGSAVFVVSERPNQVRPGSNGRATRDRSDRLGTSRPGAIGLEGSRCLYDGEPRYAVDTACNVCFEVDDVRGTSCALLRRGCPVLVPPTRVLDDHGHVTYSVVRSIVGNVCHTLLDRSKYQGPFLPGFCELQTPRDADADGCPVTHFDHIAYACPRGSTPEVMKWYERHFGFKRFFIDSNEDVNDGYILNRDGIGLRLTAMEYWRCSEAGVKLAMDDHKQPDCKFVIAESLPEQGKNQVDTFLEQHGGPGIQHIGLYTEDIATTAETMAQAGVQFFCPPPAYYTQVGKQQEIENAGHDPQMLSKHGILLDTDLRWEASPQSTPSNRYLLQVFTKPLFAEDTFFLELIERRGATGFGEGNIRALWRSVQAYMESEEAQKDTL
ncbi:4-hydroxyphenylpyruvate dioxygenase-like protein [Denticeps clupeoides]|uniref:4-hydroxyphenylpyruvate dioxygenase n=1 Tax=Denticeps clupeoides TaxID=299321 RepID=A0AAY4AAT0_9TELE|nr:4-hydroxyphenylpyruvate dioxygenase-like protein [Denticeps clupeoides]